MAMHAGLVSRPRSAAPRRPVTLSDLIDRTPELPAVPTAAMAAHRETKKDDATAQSVATLITADPALTVRVLRLANAAHFGAARQIASVPEAVSRLGMNAVRNLCLMGGAYPWLKVSLSAYNLASGVLLTHSLATAVGAKAVAKARGVDPEAAFTAGLLHDLGKVALAPWLRGVVVRNAEEERRYLGFDHAQAGGELTRRWNLPAPLTGAVACHHMPCEGLEDAVHVGDVLAYLMVGQTPRAVDVDALSRCGLADSEAFARKLMPELERHLKIAEACP